MLNISSPSFIIPTIVQVITRPDGNGQEVFDIVVGKDLLDDEERARVGELLDDESTLEQQAAFGDDTDLNDVLEDARENGCFEVWEKELASKWRTVLPSLRRMRLRYGYGEPLVPYGGVLWPGMGTASLLRLRPNDSWDISNQPCDTSYPYWKDRPRDIWDQ